LERGRLLAGLGKEAAALPPLRLAQVADLPGGDSDPSTPRGLGFRVLRFRMLRLRFRVLEFRLSVKVQAVLMDCRRFYRDFKILRV
jgi:hypothetical protein